MRCEIFLNYQNFLIDARLLNGDNRPANVLVCNVELKVAYKYDKSLISLAKPHFFKGDFGFQRVGLHCCQAIRNVRPGAAVVSFE